MHIGNNGLEGQALNVGREVTFANEKFFVVSNSSEDTANVTLITKFYVNAAANAQVNKSYIDADVKCQFSSSAISETHDADVNYDHTDAIAFKRANNYGKNIGAGRW